MKRRQVLSTMALATGASMIQCEGQAPKLKKPISQRINHSVCKWCYSRVPMEEMIDKCKDIGISSIEIIGPNHWDMVVKAGLQVGMANGSPLGILFFRQQKWNG